MTNLTVFHPTPTLRRFFRDGFPGDSLFGTLFGDFAGEASADASPDASTDALPRWSPRVDVRDRGPEVVIEADLPGVRREDLSIRFDSGTLIVEGRRGRATDAAPVGGNGDASPEVSPNDASTDAASPNDTGANGTAANGTDTEVSPNGNDRPVWSHRERVTGRFRRTFRLPETVDVSRIRAESRDGVLTITLPKLEQALPRRIEVAVH